MALAARSENQIERVVEEIRDDGGSAVAIPCDVTDESAVAALAEEAVRALGQVDVLVNNAGVAHSAKLASIDLEDWNRILAVNATGTFLCTRALAPAMAERGWGRVVNIASIAGKVGAPYIAAYAASKHAVVGFTRALSQEMATRGVTVNAVCPGYVDTEMTERSVARIVDKTGIDPEEAFEHMRQSSPQRRLFGAEEVATLVVNLCEESARGINGQAIVLDGGGVQS